MDKEKILRKRSTYEIIKGVLLIWFGLKWYIKFKKPFSQPVG